MLLAAIFDDAFKFVRVMYGAIVMSRLTYSALIDLVDWLIENSVCLFSRDTVYAMFHS